jgi:hypothetical protein
MWKAICILLLFGIPGIAAEPVYTWRSLNDDPDRVYLYRDGVQIGGWCYREQQYRPFDGKTWGQPTAAAPVTPPKDPLWLDEKLLSPVPLYVMGLAANGELFALIEMKGDLNRAFLGGELTKELTAKGSISLFQSEKAKFVERLKEEKFSDPVLAMMYLEIEDHDPKWQMDVKNGQFESSAIMATEDRAKGAQTPTRAVLLVLNHKVQDAKGAIPVVAHCSMVFLTTKEGRGVLKTLSFDLYLETLERRKDTRYGTYPWKVRNVEYK